MGGASTLPNFIQKMFTDQDTGDAAKKAAETPRSDGAPKDDRKKRPNGDKKEKKDLLYYFLISDIRSNRHKQNSTNIFNFKIYYKQ